MNHGSSLVPRQDSSGITGPSHKRRHSISRSLAKGGRRMSGWVAKVYSSSPRRVRAPAPPPLPPLPPSHPQNLRLSLLSFSTPTLSINFLPTPPPSPPESVSSLETEFTKFEMDKIRKRNSVGNMNRNSYVPTRVDILALTIATVEPPERSSGPGSALQLPTLFPSLGRTPTPPQALLKSQMDESTTLPTPPESQTGSINSTPQIPNEKLDGSSQELAPAGLQTTQIATQLCIPTQTAGQNHPHSHRPRRSMSASLTDSFTIASRRRRTTNPAIPPIPPLTITNTPTIAASTTNSATNPKVLQRRSTTSPLTPPLPQRHLRGLEVPHIPQESTIPQLLPELSFSTSPLMPSPLAITTSSSPLRKGGLRPPGSPVRTGVGRSLRLERRSILLQPSDLTRESAKATTKWAQTQAEEVGETILEGLRSKLAISDADENIENSWNGLDGVLSSTEPRFATSPKECFPERSTSLESSPKSSFIDKQPTVPLRRSQPAHTIPNDAVLIRIGQSVPVSPPSATPGDHKEHKILKPSAGASKRKTDIEAAPLSLGEFGTSSIWRKIGVYLKQGDLACLTRVSQCVKRAVEPLLYETICLRPNPPHGQSNAYLASLLNSLHTEANKPKLQAWTKSLRIENGFGVNQTMLMNHNAFLEEEAILDGSGNVLVSRWQIDELIREEGLEDDGGIQEISRYLSDILRYTSKLRKFSLASSVAMNNEALLALSGVNSLNVLELNLSQPIMKVRQRNRHKTPVWVALPKYRPSIPLVSGLPLQVLRLNNLPTRGGVTFWKQVWGTIIGISDTLRVLELEMPRIDPTRYGQLFDCYHRIVSLPDIMDDVKIPPILDWQIYKEVMSEIPVVCRQKLRLHTLELTGFIVDTEIINHEIVPGSLKKLQLIGCMERSDFRFSKKCWKGLEVFRSTGLGFIEKAIKALFTIPCEERRELAFWTDPQESCEVNPLSKLRTVVMNVFPKYGYHIENLCLKEQWILDTDELNKIFADVLDGGEGFTEIGISLVNTSAAWKIFLDGLRRCKNIRRIHVLNGFSREDISVYNKDNFKNGGVKRRAYDDALTIAEALIAAEKEGLPIDLDGIIIAIHQCVWKIEWTNNKWVLVRLKGLLKRPVVGCDALQFLPGFP